MNKFYLFGAHSRARTTARYLTERDGENILLAYLIDDDEENAEEITGFPVLDLRKNPSLDTSASVYIGTRGVNFPHATRALTALGFSELHPVDVELDTVLRTEYFRKRFAKEGRELVIIDNLKPMVSEGAEKDAGGSDGVGAEKKVCIFEVRSAYDKPLTRDAYVKAPYEKSIQVGTALTDVRLESCEYRDNEGDNISETNRQLCEITALYWMWKHTDFDITGLVHYRRHFLMPDRWVERMEANGVDIILPLPLYIEPCVEENYRFRHVSSDWDQMLDSLKKEYGEQTEAIRQCFFDTFYYPCNMFVMKKSVFEEYCGWLFPILFDVMEKVGSREDVYQNRYPAFMAERLLTLFVHLNRDRFRVAFADKNFLE